MKKYTNYNWIIVGLMGVLFVLGIVVWLVYKSTVQFTETNGIDSGSIYSNFSATIAGSFIAGILTLIGVVLTIMHYKQSDYTQQRLQHMPYMQVSFDDYISSDKNGSYQPDMYLSIGRANDPRCPSSGKSITVTNIGLGIAVNLKCKWIAEGSHAEYNLKTSLLKQDESNNSTFLISARVPNEKMESAKGRLIICFDDFLGNHYEQPVEISFMIDTRSISLVQYDVKAPQYI